MDFDAFVRKWGTRVLYRVASNGSITVTPENDAVVLPIEVAASVASITGPFRRVAKHVQHKLFVNDIHVNEATARWWNYDPKDILAATYGVILVDPSEGKPMQKFSWEPITGEWLFVPPGQNHAMSKGRAPFDDYVRAIVHPAKKLVSFRPFWPTWMQKGMGRDGAMDEDAIEVSFDAQEACEAALRRHGGAGWEFEYNATNMSLERLTGVPSSRW